MELRARTRHLLRRAVPLAALGAVALVPATAGAAPHAKASAKKKKAKAPVVTSVRPMEVAIGQTVVIRGKNFKRGKGKNTVVFKRDGARAVFVKAGLSTAKMMKVTVPSSLAEFLAVRDAAPAATRFRIRILAKRFGKSFTSIKKSPLVLPASAAPTAATPPPVPPAEGDCDGDGIRNGADADDDNDLLDDVTEASLGLNSCSGDSDGDGLADRFEFDCDRDGILNRDESDDDNDLLSDSLETAINTNPCSADSDGDKVEDGYEYRSAIDLNDDDYQHPQESLPYPGKRPYPNPMFDDANTDYDGDSLTLGEEQGLWIYTYAVTKTDPRSLEALSYSDGEQYTRSVRGVGGRRQPTLIASTYDKHSQFLSWAGSKGYRTVTLRDAAPWATGAAAGWHNYGLFDFDRSNSETTGELRYYDLPEENGQPNGYLSDDERDEDADGLSNADESHSRMIPEYWKSCYAMEKPYYIAYAGTSMTDADSDGDGILDAADDQDHDDVPNVMELSRFAASHIDDNKDGFICTADEGLPVDFNHYDTYGRVNPYNPCLPDPRSRTCPRYVNTDTGAPWDGSVNWLSLQ